MQQFKIGKCLSEKDKLKQQLDKARQDKDYVLARILYKQWEEAI